MTNSATKDCGICGEAIPAAAIKCRHCGSFQNWRRFLDLGHGTIALLIALISVTTLGVETGTRAFDSLFHNPLSPQVSGRVLSLSLDEVELLFSNNGSSRVLLSEGALCRIPMVREGVTLITDTGELVRHPKREEVEALVSVFYSAGGDGRFLEGNSALRVRAKRTSVLREEGLPLKPGTGEVRGYCSVDWIGQDGGDDGDFWLIPALDIHEASERLAGFPYGETINAKAEGRERDRTPLRREAKKVD